ncbi:RNase adaptor protein RapZ, partial [Pseudomonas ogarae]
MDGGWLLGAIADQADGKCKTAHLDRYEVGGAVTLRLLNPPEPGTAFMVESFGFK